MVGKSEKSKTTVAKFNPAWCEEEEFKLWLVCPPGTDTSTAYCTLCKTGFSVASMGKSGLRSHASGAKHKKLVEHGKGKSFTILDYGVKKNIVVPSSVSSESAASADSGGSSAVALPRNRAGCVTIQSSFTKSDVLRSEIVWVLKVVKSNHSFRSCDSLNELFESMFADSQIAQQFRLSKDKCSYMIKFGLGPFGR